ncbi:hypothetical protein, partial [Arcanobacterium phocae]|uniref:hypothetical protein n=1 Tax=Arcanobacterium phocae TaxID=131112 RepID=UPI0020A1A0A6
MFVFVVASPNVSAVFAGGVPGFTSVPAAALSAFDTRCERVVAGFAWGGSPGDFGLHQVPHGRVNDCFMVTC